MVLKHLVFVVPENLNSPDNTHKFNYYYLFLEQFHLLNKKFNLNIQIIVYFRVNLGNKVYIYD